MSNKNEITVEEHLEIQHHVKTYINVFVALIILTFITVAVSYLKVSFIEAFFLAVTIATIKGSLVLGFFMHLISEKQAVIWILISTVIAFLILMFLPLVTMTDHTSIW